MAEQITGRLELLNPASNVTIVVDGDTGSIAANGPNGSPIFHFDSRYAALWLGGTGNEGDLIVRDQNDVDRIKLDGGDGNIWVKDPQGRTWLLFDSRYAALWLGGEGNEGDLIVRDAQNRERIKLDGGDGDIWVKDPQGRTWLLFDSKYAALYVGGEGNEGDVIVRDAQNRERIKLDGNDGDIILSNADVAEDFDVKGTVAQGSVMVMGTGGMLEPCSRPYDRRAMGVVSGAGRYQPGMVLDRQGTKVPGRVPISVLGKVECLADTSSGPIEVGDLLTTSATSGHAMAVRETERSHGAIVGKALGHLDEGSGLIPMLVSLR